MTATAEIILRIKHGENFGEIWVGAEKKAKNGPKAGK